MYRVIVTNDEILERGGLGRQIIKAHCVEFTAELADTTDIRTVIANAIPDVVVMGLDTAKKYRCFTENADTEFLIVYDSFESDDIPKIKSKNMSIFDVQSEEYIAKVISRLINKLKSSRAKGNFEKMVIREAERVKPIIREQFFKEFIGGGGNTDEIFNIYCQTFSVSPNMRVHMLLFHPESETDFEDVQFLKNVIESHIGMDNIMISTVMKDHILLVSTIESANRITTILKRLAKVFEKYYSCDITTAYSNLRPIREMPQAYERLKKSLDYCFYTGNGHILAADEADMDGDASELEPNYGAIERAVKSADEEKVELLLCTFFDEMERAKADPAVARTYCLELYVCIIRCCEVERIYKYMRGIPELQELKTLPEIKDYIFGIANEIIQSNSPAKNKLYSALIAETMDIIEKNIGNENLSLRWIAKNILYTNVDYLGKLFKKEIGENFSRFVMEKRMELAKQMIVEGKKDRIYEVAEKVGYGSNSQYFSQVFKKYTGVSPLEYKEYARAAVN